jgi:hypothetical protein
MGSDNGQAETDEPSQKSSNSTDETDTSSGDEETATPRDDNKQDTDEQAATTSEDEREDQRPPLEQLKDEVTKQRLLGGVGILLALILVVLLIFVPWSLLGLVFTSSAEFDAQPVTVEQATVTGQGYEAVSDERFVVTEQLSFVGQTKSIITTNHRKNYERTVDVQGEQFDAAIFTVVSTPAIAVADNPQNPLAEMSHGDLLAEFSSDLEGGYDGMGEFTKLEDREGVLLGQRTTISQFETTVTENGQEVTVYLYVTTVRSSGDIVVAVGGHPAPFAQERVPVFEMMAAVEHPSGN